MFTFRAASDDAARAIAENFDQSGMQGFSHDPTSHEFSIATPEPSETVRDGIRQFIDEQSERGNIQVGSGAQGAGAGGAQIKKGRFELVFDSDYRGVIKGHQRRAAAGDARPADQGRAARANSLIAEVQARLSAFET
jgi:hypothetical protein